MYTEKGGRMALTNSACYRHHVNETDYGILENWKTVGHSIQDNLISWR